MKIDLNKFVTKGPMRAIVVKAVGYRALMLQQGKPASRIVVSKEHYDTLLRSVQRSYPNATYLLLTVFDTPVFWNAHDPLPEPPPYVPPPPPIKIENYSSPFGGIGEVPKAEHLTDSHDDDIPF